MYVKIEQENTLIMVLEEDRLVLQRSLSYGIGLGEMSDEEIIDGIRPILGTISRIMHFYSGQSYKHIDKVCLIGKGANYVDLFNEAGEGSDINFIALATRDLVRLQKNVKDAEVSGYIACFGAGISPVKLINYKPAYKRVNYKRASVLMVILYCMVLATLGLSSYIPYFDAKVKNDRLNREALKYENAQLTHESYIALQDFYKSFVYGEEQTKHTNDGLLAFLEELEKNLPSDVIVNALASNDEMVVLQLEVQSKEEAAGVIDMFRGFDTLMNVSVASIAADDRISFTITCEYYPVYTEENIKEAE